MRGVSQEIQGATWAPNDSQVIGALGEPAPAAAQGAPMPVAAAAFVPTLQASAEQIRRATLDSLRALMFIRAYRVRGHLEAKLDPLELNKPAPHPELDPKTYGFTDEDLSRPIFINYVLGLEVATLREIRDILRATYCGSIGVEFMHIQEPDQKAWIQERIEGARNQTKFTANGKRAILGGLTRAESDWTFPRQKVHRRKAFRS